MRIAVIGAGALGCLFGGRLAASGHDVWLLHHRQKYVDRLRADGINLFDDGDGPLEIDVPVTADAEDVAPVDLALVLVKAHQTSHAMKQHRACLDERTRILTLQNGLRNRDRLMSFVDSNRVLAGVTYEGAMIEAPGDVYHTAAGGSIVGGPDRTFAEEVAAVFDDAGLGVTVVDDPEPVIWDKQLVSLAVKPFAALTRLPNDELLKRDDLWWAMSCVLEEAVAVGTARGVDFPHDEPQAAALERLAKIRKRADGHRSSMLQDVESGRRTEIDEINGAIVSFAEDCSVEVPFNRVLTALVRGLEYGYSAR
ncbi:ketopantoate reductase family protein [Natronomonas amylolytica]|uniref:ketopantoate reductase family protein n=1 Tax=Natronomonas amylolytica TaxID=3108498 RepID=UPI003007F7F2